MAKEDSEAYTLALEALAAYADATKNSGLFSDDEWTEVLKHIQNLFDLIEKKGNTL